jgi:uroporphyrinogen III methyltransferase / synthase
MGKVYIVGAGPGDISDLTLRAQNLLNTADVVIYDALVDETLLEFLPPHCQQVYVGKRGGQPSMTQTEINQILVAHGQRDRQTVRLKSGDPFIFGRTMSEIDALSAAGCEYEIVPGLSSALAAPLLAGIPLTDPVLSCGFAVVSAHAPEDLNWDALVQLPTLVILMGASTLATTVRGLLKHGRAPHTPIAIIKWASLPQQEVLVSDLGHVVAEVGDRSFSPAVIVIGEVVKLRQFINSQTEQRQTLPLQGQTVLVTRSLSQSPELRQLLTVQGARVLEMPTLEIGAPSSWEALDRSISQISHYNWLILTSANAVNYFFDRLTTAGQDARALAGVKIAVVGHKTAEVLRQHGINPDFIPPEFIADTLVASFPESPHGQKILFPRVESGGRAVIVQSLVAQGAMVDEVAAYQSVCPQDIDPTALAALQQQHVDIITFASSKTVQHFHQLVGNQLPANWLAGVRIASIGPQTSATCQELFGKVDLEATEYTLPGLVAAIVAHPETRAVPTPVPPIGSLNLGQN